jgi:hypothetical protein
VLQDICEVNDMTQTTKKPKLTREQKARNLFNAGVRPIKTADGWEVMGSNGAFYEVREELDGEWLCSCADFQFRGFGATATDLCKHIQLVRLCEEFDRAVCEINDAPIANWQNIHTKKNVVVVF